MRTNFKENPGIKSGKLWRKVGEKTDYGRSALYEQFNSFEEQGKMVRDKGKCFLPKQFENYIQTKKYPKKRFVTKADLEIYLNHSRKLILGLEAFFVDDQLLYPQLAPWVSDVRIEGTKIKLFAQEHLKSGYPAISKKLKEYLEARAEFKQLLQKKGYSRDLVNEIRLFITTKMGLHKQYMSNEQINWILSRSKKAPIDLVEILQKNIVTFFELATEINTLKEKIEHGEPLSGSCKLCPNVRIDS